MKNFSLQTILTAVQVDPILSILVVLSVGIILISLVFARRTVICVKQTCFYVTYPDPIALTFV